MFSSIGFILVLLTPSGAIHDLKQFDGISNVYVTYNDCQEALEKAREVTSLQLSAARCIQVVKRKDKSKYEQ